MDILLILGLAVGLLVLVTLLDGLLYYRPWFGTQSNQWPDWYEVGSPLLALFLLGFGCVSLIFGLATDDFLGINEDFWRIAGIVLISTVGGWLLTELLIWLVAPGLRRFLALMGLIGGIALLLLILGFADIDFNDEEKAVVIQPSPTAAPDGTVVTTSTTSVSGVVRDTAGNPITGAIVRVVGPLNAPTPAVPHETTTDENGYFTVNLPAGDGRYDVSAVLAPGFDRAALVATDGVLDTPGEIDTIVGHVDIGAITLKKPSEFIPGGVSAAPGSIAVGREGFVIGGGVVDRDEVIRVLLLHAIINDATEVLEIADRDSAGNPITMQGRWSTFIRDGQVVSLQPYTYARPTPAWRVVLNSGEVIYVQRACGNISVPPGQKLPPPKVVPPPETPTPTVPPTPTPSPKITPTLAPTPTPKVTPTPTPVPTPLFVPGCGEFLEHASDPSLLFWREANFVSNLPVASWIVEGGLILWQTDRQVRVRAPEGATVTVKVILVGETQVRHVCTQVVPISEFGSTPAPTRTPAPTPTPGPPPPTPHWTPQPPP